VQVIYTYVPGSLSGFVYTDCNNDGIREPGEEPIANVLLTLTGTNDQGPITPQTTHTDATGFYQFSSLRPGTYTVTETQPAGFFDGLDSRGNVPIPGSVGTDVINNIVLTAGGEANENNFGELIPGTVSGSVYVDLNKNGIKNPGEPGIPNVKLTL